MGNSLLINGLEMVGFITNPEYHLAQSDTTGANVLGQDFGEILPDTAVISSVLLDGDVITGERTGNRTWNLVITVQSTSNPPTRADLSAKVNTLVQAINADTYPVIWTPDGGASSVFTAYRATFSVAKSFTLNGQLVAQVVLSFDTAPFAKSLNPTMLSVAASGSAPQLQIDGMNTSPFTNGTLNTSTKFEGTGSCSFTMAKTVVGDHLIYTSPVVGRALSSDDLSSYDSISVRLQMAALPAAPGGAAATTVTLHLTSAGVTYTVPFAYTAHPGDATWILATFDTTSTAANLTAVTQWGVDVVTSMTNPPASPGSITSFIDDLRAYPPGSVGNATANGSVITVPGVTGSARTPAALEIDLGGTTFTNVVVHSPPPDQDPDLAILVGLSAGSVTVPAQDMNYDGTYGVVVFSTFAGGGGSRTVTVTFTQKLGSTTLATATLTTAVTNANSAIPLGNITLPLVEFPPESNSGSLIIAVTSTNGGDSILSVALCDTQGQTIFVQNMASTTEAFYIDAPDPLVGVGPMYASTSVGRTNAYNVMSDLIAMPGGPILLEPGNNRILVASGWGAPNLAVTYTPSWLDEALS